VTAASAGPDGPPGSTPQRSRGVALVAAAAAAAGVVIAVAVTTSSAPADSADDRAPTPSTETVEAVSRPPARTVRVPAREAVPAGSQINPERPDLIVLPSGTRVRVRLASTLRNGTFAVPANIDAAGWWDGGARIGDPFGAILIAGHVDSAVQGLGPFAELLGVGTGDPVVLESRQLRQAFVIRSVALLPKAELAEQSGLFAVDGAPRLILVTCAGPFDADAGGYQNLAVVTATPSGGVEDH